MTYMLGWLPVNDLIQEFMGFFLFLKANVDRLEKECIRIYSIDYKFHRKPINNRLEMN